MIWIMQRMYTLSGPLKYYLKNFSEMKSILQLIFISIIFYSCEKTRLPGVPECIEKKVAEFKRQPKGNPPKSITQYLYQGKLVYYVPGQCCDQYSDLVNENCNLLGHPDGGFTGRGDGTLPNFFTDATDAKLIWKDER